MAQATGDVVPAVRERALAALAASLSSSLLPDDHLFSLLSLLFPICSPCQSSPCVGGESFLRSLPNPRSKLTLCLFPPPVDDSIIGAGWISSQMASDLLIDPSTFVPFLALLARIPTADSFSDSWIFQPRRGGGQPSGRGCCCAHALSSPGLHQGRSEGRSPRKSLRELRRTYRRLRTSSESIFSLCPIKLTCMHLLLRRQDVDCVYIGTTNPEHFEPAKKALEAGKVSSLPFDSSRCSGRG